MLGRNSAPHDAVRDVLAHMVKNCGITDAAVVESPVEAADGDSTVADVVYVDNVSGKRVILEVSVVTVGSDSALSGSAREASHAAHTHRLIGWAHSCAGYPAGPRRCLVLLQRRQGNSTSPIYVSSAPAPRCPAPGGSERRCRAGSAAELGRSLALEGARRERCSDLCPEVNDRPLRVHACR